MGDNKQIIMSIKVKNKDLKGTDKQIVETYYKLLQSTREKNPELTKDKAVEFAVIMISKVYARSVLDELEKLEHVQPVDTKVN